TRWLSGSLLILRLTLIAYAPAMRSGFIWDDDANLTQNAAVTEPGGFRRISLDPTACPQYYPITYSVFSLENRLWRLDPVGYHVVNVALHGANSLLVWVVLRGNRMPGGWLAAALYALHPIEVESVAWVTEPKNTLSGLFALLSLWCYTRFQPLAEDDAALRIAQQNWTWYGLSVGFFVLALLSKSVTAMLAPVLLVWEWWTRPRLTPRDVLPLVPFFVLGAVMGLNTAWIESRLIGAEGRMTRPPPAEKILIAGAAFCFSRGKIAAPMNLAFIYPPWPLAPAQARQWLPLVAATLVMACLF